MSNASEITLTDVHCALEKVKRLQGKSRLIRGHIILSVLQNIMHLKDKWHVLLVTFPIFMLGIIHDVIYSSNSCQSVQNTQY